MTSRDFVIWLKGFSEACHEFHPTPKQWDRLKDVLNEVEDYNDYGDLDEDVEDSYSKEASFFRGNGTTAHTIPLSGSVSFNNYTFASSSGATAYSTTVWNDKMGCWHYTNYPEGFGYYHNSQEKKEKQLLND